VEFLFPDSIDPRNSRRNMLGLALVSAPMSGSAKAE